MTQPRRYAWLLWLALFAVWFGTLDYRKLVRPDEGRYAEIPREMVASGDWLTPHLNGIKYFEKPPLQYWATASAYKLFGEHEWTARLWPALCGFFGIVLTWITGRRLWGPREGALAAAILASSTLYLLMAQAITLDMGLSFFLQLAWTGFILAQISDAHTSRRWMWATWIALALAVLTKGLVALVLSGGTLIAYSILNRDLSPWRRLSPVAGLLLFLAVAAPWFVAVSLVNPEFPHFFFIHEHFDRFLTTEHRRYQPDWYFFPIYMVGALPWSLLLLHALAGSWRRVGEAQFQPQRFLLLWIALTFGFFSLSSSKLMPYILPIFPALALLGGKTLAALPRRTLLIHFGILATMALAMLGLAPHLVDVADHEDTVAMLSGYAHWLEAAAAIWVASILIGGVCVWRGKSFSALLALALGGGLASMGVLLGHENLQLSNSSYHVAGQVAPLLTPGVPFYSVQKYEQTLPFYIKRTVTLVDYQDEMAFGLQQEPDKWIPSVGEFRQRWLADRDAFAIMSPDTFNRLRSEGLPMTEISRDTRSVVVRKPQ